MNIHIMTLFPEMVMGGLNTSITGRAISKGILSIEAVNIRDVEAPVGQCSGKDSSGSGSKVNSKYGGH